ncbi:hypothetical protein CHU98_g5709 [Xylaria longipes]|nr:hypothetical protein CHU98_g5709 [Xylaria longipes]
MSYLIPSLIDLPSTICGGSTVSPGFPIGSSRRVLGWVPFRSGAPVPEIISTPTPPEPCAASVIQPARLTALVMPPEARQYYVSNKRLNLTSDLFLLLEMAEAWTAIIPYMAKCDAGEPAARGTTTECRTVDISLSVKKHTRQYDVVVYGATGYTGLLTAEFIASHFPTDTKWAVAGRSAQKLEDVVKTCQSLNPDRKPPQVEVCGLDDADLAALAKKTFAFIATVGPYAKYGEHAFKACAEVGTHYFDCTGEAVWHAAMIKKYQKAAKASGACMFPQSAVESAPSDLVTFALASLIKSELSVPVGDVVVSLHEIRSAPSGGTLATLIGLFETFSFKEVAASHKPYALSPVPNSKSAPKASIQSKLTGAYHVPNLGIQSTSLTAGTDAAVVHRTWGIFQQEAALQKHAYGPNFTYREFMKTRNVVTAMIMHYSLIIGGALLAFCSPFRNLLRRYVFQPGQGPSREDAAKEYLEFRGVATPDVQPASGKQAFCRAWYHGGMYLPQTLLEDDVGLSGGIYTPACLGQGYIDRLDEAGFKIETKIIEN